MTDGQKPRTTTDAGIPAASDDYSLTVGADGPILLQDHYLIQKMAHFNRERVPERVVHAKGGGAFGFFEATEDVSEFCKADFLQPGQADTPCSPASPPWPASWVHADTVRDPRGFALKFYTDEGNYDLVGNNTPVFFIRDPVEVLRTSSTPRSGCPTPASRDNNMQWDFWTLTAGIGPPGHDPHVRPRAPRRRGAT